MRTILSIAGSDCSGGAGIQADIKTITVHKLYAMSVITALTAQNTTGVSGVLEVSPEFVAEQLDMVFTDIRPDAIKIGMVSNRRTIEVIADKLIQYQAKKVVLDPVMIATSGSRLIDGDAVELLTKRLMPLVDVITPNIPEAEVLSGITVNSKAEMVQAAEKIAEYYHGAILIKGGHLTGSSDDLLYEPSGLYWYETPRIDNPNTHGTGCTLSSAIACNLAHGIDIPKSIALAKEYLTGALSSGLDLGRGSGPLNHCYRLSLNTRNF